MKNILLFLSLAIGGTAIAQNTCTPLITNGLIAYYPFCGNANDVSGNNLNGTNWGATLTTDRFGNPNSAYSFDGTSNYISVADNALLHFTNRYSISAWFYATALSGVTDSREIVSKAMNSTQGGVTINLDNLQNYDLASDNTDGSGAHLINSNIIPNLNTWYHVAITYDGTTLKIYVNGQLTNSMAYTISLTNSTHELDFGSQQIGLDDYFAGKIDDIALWNRALSGSEITSLYTNSTSSNCLVAYYPFSGSAVDSSGNNLNGTVHGATLTTDRFGNPNSAYSFDGISNYISVADNALLHLTNDYSLSAWFYATALSGVTDSREIVSKAMNTTQGGLTINLDNLQNYDLASDNTDGSGAHLINSNTIPTLNTWYHVAVTYDGTTLKIYVNGQLANSMAYTISLNDSTHELDFGSQQIGLDDYFAGKIDEVRIYNCALTASDVQALYDGTTGIKEISKKSDFTVYPNPTNGIVFIKGITNENIVVYNSLGAIVKDSKARNTVDLSLYSEGLYFVQVINNRGEIVYTTKILRQ